MIRPIVVLLLAACALPVRAEDPAPADSPTEQEFERIRRELEEQKKKNQEIERRLDELAGKPGDASDRGKADKAGALDDGMELRLRLGKSPTNRLRPETMWADGDLNPFAYLRIAETETPASPASDTGGKAEPRRRDKGEYDKGDLPSGLYYGSKSTFAEFHGFINFEYLDFREDGYRAGRSTFDLHHIYLSARAEVMEDLAAFIEIEYEHGGESEIMVDRGFIEWRIHDALTIQLGQRFSPMGIERQQTALAPLKNAISNPVMLDMIGYGDWMMVGVFALGKFPLGFWGATFDYTVGAINGPDGLARSEGGSVRDNNGSKSGVLDIGVSPFIDHEILGSLRIGASHLLRTRYSESGGSESTRKTNLTWVDLHWVAHGFELRGEYAWRRADDDPVAGIRGNARGWYVELAAAVAPAFFDVPLPFSEKNFHRIEPFVRFNRSSTPLASASFTTANPGETISRWDMGIMISPYPHLKFRAEYQLSHEHGQPELNNDGLLFSATLDF